MNHHPESSEPLMFDRKRLNNRPLFPGFPSLPHSENDAMTTSDTRMTGVAQTTPAGNFIDVERYQTYVKITNFREIPRILINTPTFQFDGHGDTTGWQLMVNQRHFNGRSTKTVVRLLHGSNAHQEGVRIRLGGGIGNAPIRGIDDVVNMFSGDFDIVHAHRLAMGPRFSDVRDLTSRAKRQEMIIGDLRARNAVLETEIKQLDQLVKDQGSAQQSTPVDLSGFSSEELLAEVHRRTMEAIGDYRGSKRMEPITLDNIVNLDDVKRIRFDESRLQEILAA